MRLLFLISLLLLHAVPAAAQEQPICLILSEDTSFDSRQIKFGAVSQASDIGVEMWVFSGRYSGDVETQVVAIETCIANGAQGILIQPSDPNALRHAVDLARWEGLQIIALERRLDPPSAATSTILHNWENFDFSSIIGSSYSIDNPKVAVVAGDLSKLDYVGREAEGVDIIISTGNTNWPSVTTSPLINAQQIIAAGQGCNGVEAVEQGRAASALIKQPSAVGSTGVDLLASSRGEASDITIPPILVGQSGMSPAEAKQICNPSKSLSSEANLVWTGSFASNDDCPTCPPSGACAQEILIAKAACCPRTGACAQ